MSAHPARDIVVAFDTANEVIALGLGQVDPDGRAIRPVASRELAAHRASNTLLVQTIDDLLMENDLQRSRVACIACGRGPGSFTGVRIALATAKGLALGLSLPLVGLSTLEAVAWGVWQAGVRGRLLVVADAMRHEVYPAHFLLEDSGCERLEADSVIKVEALCEALPSGDDPLCGDALVKYEEQFASKGTLLPRELWSPSGEGLLLALQAKLRAGEPIFDRRVFDPGIALPVYTRLSDAEENERARLAQQREGAVPPRDLASGVMTPTTPGSETPFALSPLRRDQCGAVAALEQEVMAADAWSEELLADELAHRDRSWWVALDGQDAVIGYAGGRVVDGQLELLKIGVTAAARRRGIARALYEQLAEDGRNLGAESITLEVRLSNEDAQAFYTTMGLESVGPRPGYYADREDALIMTGPMPDHAHPISADSAPTVAGMTLDELPLQSSALPSPIILAIETSCDETACAIIDGEGTLHASVVASQVDFHARFGGVVPEIASRKHIEALCGVVDAALEAAGCAPRDLDAVAVTAAPGLVGALVVGVAFAKGLAWALDKPLIAVNHLEGHLYANKLADPAFAPPAIASLVSGGHTLLVFMKDWGVYETLGSTIDDAVGEAFDKVAKAMGLGYPGGPVISRLAASGDPSAIKFPRAMLHSGDLRFSLSGLKTAVLTYMQQEEAAGRPLNLPDIAAGFQQAVIDVQIAKAQQALEQTGATTLALGGGVAANPALRQAYEDLARRLSVKLVMAPLEVCGDNAAMIALVALDHYKAGRFAALDLDAQAHADL